jgi:hypothetical protein
VLSGHSFLSPSVMIISLSLSVGGLTAGVGAVASVSAYTSEPATADLARVHVPAHEDLLLAHGSSLSLLRVTITRGKKDPGLFPKRRARVAKLESKEPTVPAVEP